VNPSAYARKRPCLALSALACALVLTAAGCGEGPAGDGLATPPAPPAPAEVGAVAAQVPAAATPGPDPTCSDVTASLRPQGTLPEPTALPAGSRMREIRDRGWLVAGVDQSSYPFGYVDPTDNTLRGFDIDLLREVSAAIFGDRRQDRIRFRVLRNEDRARAVERGDVDIVAETMTINCDRRKTVDFSSVYFEAGQRVLVQKDGKADVADYTGGLPGLPAGMRVCSVQGSTSIKLLREQAPQAQEVVGDTWADCLVLLQQGTADAITTDDTILSGLQTQDRIFTVVVGPKITYEPYGMAISKSHPDLVRFVNGVLERLRTNGRWQQLYSTYLGTSLSERTPAPPGARYRDER